MAKSAHYREPKILGLLSHWRIRSKTEASYHPAPGYEYRLSQERAFGAGPGSLNGWVVFLFEPGHETGARLTKPQVHAYKAAELAERDWREYAYGTLLHLPSRTGGEYSGDPALTARIKALVGKK
jgi:hypothetical protein